MMRPVAPTTLDAAIALCDLALNAKLIKRKILELKRLEKQLTAGAAKLAKAKTDAAAILAEAEQEAQKIIADWTEQKGKLNAREDALTIREKNIGRVEN